MKFIVNLKLLIGNKKEIMSFINYLQEKTDFLINEKEEDRLESIFLFACLTAANKKEKIVKSNDEVKSFLKDLRKFQENCKEILGKNLVFLKNIEMVDLAYSFNEQMKIEDLMTAYLNLSKSSLRDAMIKLDFIEVVKINKLISELFNEIKLADIFSKLNSDSLVINKKEITNGVQVPFL